MGWFRKILNIFTVEVEDTIEPQENTLIEKKQNEPYRTMETRMKYQYPKGNFRFPAIPDEKRTRNSNRSISKREEPVKQKVKQPIELEKERVYIQKSARKIEPKNRQPFRPTEIPSPVYGFSRPKQAKKEEEICEYELTSMNDLQLKKMDGIRKEIEQPREAVQQMAEEQPRVRVQQMKEMQQRVPVQQAVEEQPRVRVQQAVEEQPREAVQQMAEEQPKVRVQQTAEEQQLREAVQQTEEMQQREAVQQTEEMQQREAVQQTEEMQPREAVQQMAEEQQPREAVQQMVEEQPRIPVQQTEEEMRTLPIQKTKEENEAFPTLMFNEAELQEVPSMNVEQETQEIQPLMKAEENNPTFQSEEKFIQEFSETVDEIAVGVEKDFQIDRKPLSQNSPSNDGDLGFEEGAAMIEADEASDTVEKPNRSHIPFNVLMLKQDRQKLEKKFKKETSVKIEPESVLTINQENDLDMEPIQSYMFPSFQLLIPPVEKSLDHDWIQEQSTILNETLLNFNVRARVVNVSQGPSVTRFEIQPEPGVKVNKITNLSDDIKLSLAARDIRIEAPIPGKHAIGIEIPNVSSRPVMISEIISSEVFKESDSPLTAAMGLDISGNPIITDLRKMPHGLIAGATGSGKSVCINSILVSLLYKAKPSELKLLLIDPKMVELAPYNHIPHLVSPVITDVKAATAALKWAVEEMERRYELFAHTGVRDIKKYNEVAEQNRQFNQKLPYIVIVIDELADLMMMSPADVEEAICRIAQKARACGIHLIIATQRPSVDVITGLIKANVPTRIAFSVSSQVDSRTIIDVSGAEKLLGRGDMLFLENGSSKPARIQGTFVTDDEIDRIVAHVRNEEKPNYLFEQDELLKKAQIEDEEDEIFFEACEFVIEQGGASTSLLQRNFRIGYNRAARLIEMMEQQGIISEAKGSKPRDVLISRDDLEVAYGNQMK
ncbi:FtsK/SpoIIIE domain-containing protein [Heyndrickxia oleronia]|uniref:DNA translocase FtsK n=1 Tax=Heyndrickxia oleronia TaxID=38875 RepID=UPI00203B0FCC|nr:DNA translocase FtsK [Heyndrickxia oleronia]MCM3456013.1 FtsK/SpoIIIE domain-containing protein [Heyndrickxia oleronia]